MKRFQSILCATLLTLSMSSAAFAGHISGKAGHISGAPGHISGAPSDITDSSLLDTIFGLILGSLIP